MLTQHRTCKHDAGRRYKIHTQTVEVGQTPPTPEAQTTVLPSAIHYYPVLSTEPLCHQIYKILPQILFRQYYRNQTILRWLKEMHSWNRPAPVQEDHKLDGQWTRAHEAIYHKVLQTFPRSLSDPITAENKAESEGLCNEGQPTASQKQDFNLMESHF